MLNVIFKSFYLLLLLFKSQNIVILKSIEIFNGVCKIDVGVCIYDCLFCTTGCTIYWNRQRQLPCPLFSAICSRLLLLLSCFPGLLEIMPANSFSRFFVLLMSLFRIVTNTNLSCL